MKSACNDGKPWTENDQVQLAVLHAAGSTWRKLGKALGRTEEACRNKAVRIGLFEPAR